MRTITDDQNKQQAASVAMIEPVGAHSGMHYYDRGLCKGLLAAGCRVDLYTCDETTDPLIPGLAFRPYYKGIYGKRNRWLRGLRYLSGTLASLWSAILSGETICHYHVFNDLMAEFVVIVSAKLHRRKLVLTVHDVDSMAESLPGKRRISAWLYQLADRVIVHNETSRSELESLGIYSERIHVIAHGHYIDSAGKMPLQEDSRRALKINESAKVILFFGQIKDSKGLDLLIHSIPKVAARVPNVVLLIAGRPWKTDFARYDAIIEKENVGDRCKLHIGHIPDEDVATCFGAADVVALPYRRIYQSGVILMAMSFGRAVVVSDLPGMTDVVKDGFNGYVFKDGSADDLAKTLIRALTYEKIRHQVSDCASDYIRDHHYWDSIGRSTACVYKELLRS